MPLRVRWNHGDANPSEAATQASVRTRMGVDHAHRVRDTSFAFNRCDGRREAIVTAC